MDSSILICNNLLQDILIYFFVENDLVQLVHLVRQLNNQKCPTNSFSPSFPSWTYVISVGLLLLSRMIRSFKPWKQCSARIYVVQRASF